MGETVAALIDRLKRTVDVDEDTAGILRELSQAKRVNGATAEVEVATPSLGDLLAAGAYDRVLEVAAAAERTREIVEVALWAAQWIDSIEAARSALDIFGQAPAEVQAEFSQHRVMSSMVEALRELVEAGAPHPELRNWNEFFENLWQHPNWPEAVETAAHGAVEWLARDLGSDAISALAGHITRGASTAPTVFGRIVPYVIEWLDGVPEDVRASFVEVDEAFVACLALEDETRLGLDLLGTFATDVITRGLGADRYGFVLDSLEERWLRARSPTTAFWAADMIEVVLDEPCPDRSRRLAFASTLLQTSAEFFLRTPGEVRTVLVELSTALGLRDLLPLTRDGEGEVPDDKDLTNLVVALYSLTESALHRARDILRRQWPRLEVFPRADAVGSDDLAALARRADLFVLAPRSAKHAATLFITDRRPAGLATRFARGKGAASLVREVAEWIAGL
jgi:hypothetical protein